MRQSEKSNNRTSLISNKENLGLPTSLNKAISIAKGSYIARMDADDISIKERLEIQVNFMERHQNIGICGTHAMFIDENNNLKRRLNLQNDDRDLKNAIWFYCPFVHPSIMCRADLIKSIKYDENCRIAQDWDLWIRLSEITKFANINKVLILYRENPNNAPKKAGNSKSITSKIYLAQKFIKNFSVSSNIETLFLKYFSSQELSKDEFNELFYALTKSKFLAKSKKYVIGIYCKSMIKQGLYNLISNPIIKAFPIDYLKAITFELHRFLRTKYAICHLEDYKKYLK